MARPFRPAVTFVGLLAACPPGPGETSATDTNTGETSTTDGATETASATGLTTSAGEPCTPPPQGMEQFVPVAETPELMEVLSACPGIISQPSFPPSTSLRIFIYRPTTDLNIMPPPWPAVRLPTVIFAPGNGQNVLTDSGSSAYEHIFYPLVADGFIVAAIDLPSSDPDDTFFRTNAIACTINWLETN